jgi:cephalosporin-C deacetylase-like acetyl esterase
MYLVTFLKKLKRLFSVILALTLVFHYGSVIAQSNSEKTISNNDDTDAGEVSTILTPHNKDAVFRNNATYTFSVKSTYGNAEVGRVSYLLTDQFNKPLLRDSIHVSIPANSTKDFDFTIPEDKTGFYKINFMINVSDYDDTTRRVFGIRADEIHSAYKKPADFNQFWASTRTELEAVNPDFKIIEQPDREKFGEKVYIIQMRSLDNMLIRGWMTVPKMTRENQKFPVLIMLPGYQIDTQPLLGATADMIFISADVRGQGLNRAVLDLPHEEYIMHNIGNKYKYYLRGVIMDCVRYVDFACSRPEVDKSRIAVTGGSMGGYSSIATAAIDHRVALCAPQNPFMSDVYNMDNGATVWPLQQMKRYVAIRPALTFDKLMQNLQYFDTKNFATMVLCPVLMGIGLLDPYVPPNNSFAVYNNINAKKKIIIFKDLGHEVGEKYGLYEERWIRDQFAMF